MKLQAKDKLGGGDGKISDYEFRIRVTKAIRNGGQDVIEDEATPFINRAAREGKKHFDLIKKEGQSVRIFEKEVKGVLKVLRDKLNRATDDDTKAPILSILAEYPPIPKTLTIVTEPALRKYSRTVNGTYKS